MAKQIVQISDYTFNAAARTVTFGAAYTGLELANVELITNVVSGTNLIIYQFNKPGKGGSLAGLILTLAFDTTSMSNSDPLMIIVEATFLGSGGAGLTDTELRASPVPVSANAGTNLNTSALALETTLQSVKNALEVIDNFISGSRGLITEDNSAAILAELQAIGLGIPVLGPLTDTELRASPVAVTGGGGTEYTEDVLLPADPVGSLSMARKRGNRTSEVDTDGNAIVLNATEFGELMISITDMTEILRRALMVFSDIGSALLSGPSRLAVDLGNTMLPTVSVVTTVAAVNAVTSVVSLTDIILFGNRPAGGVVDNSATLIAEQQFNRILTY